MLVCFCHPADVFAGSQNSLFRIFDNIVRSSPAAREAVLAYLGQAAALNAKRAAMRVDPNTVSTERFVTNLHAILLRFAEPFMDTSFSQGARRVARRACWNGESEPNGRDIGKLFPQDYAAGSQLSRWSRQTKRSTKCGLAGGR